MRTSFSVNDMTIYRLVEQESGFTPMLDFLPTLSKETLGENLAWLAPGGYDSASGNVVLCFQSYVVKTPHHNILVDSCIGNDKNFPLRPVWNKIFLKHLSAEMRRQGLNRQQAKRAAAHSIEMMREIGELNMPPHRKAD